MSSVTNHGILKGRHRQPSQVREADHNQVHLELPSYNEISEEAPLTSSKKLAQTKSRSEHSGS